MSTPRFGVSTHLFHDSTARPRAPGRDCRARVRVRRGVRHPHALRLPRRRRRARAGRMARGHAADAQLDARADLRQPRQRRVGRDLFHRDRRRRAAAAGARTKRKRRSPWRNTIPYRHLVVHLGRAGRVEAGAVRQQPRRGAPQHRDAARDGAAGRRAAGHRSHPQPAVDAGGARVVDRKRPRGRRMSASAWTWATRS